MRETLLIRLAPHPALRIEFACVDEAGKLTTPVRVGDLSDAVEDATGRRVLVLVPAAEMLLTQVTVPSNNRQRVRKAVPFALEDTLAEDVDELHFALGRQDGQQQWPVAVVARERMDAWLARLHEAGLLPDRLVPESVALPLTLGSSSLLLEEEHALLRDQPASAQVVTADTLAGLLDLMTARNEEGIELRVWHCGGELPTWLAPVSAKVEPCDGGPLAVFAQGLAESENPIDLLQGAYSRKEQYSQLWRPWRAAAILLLVSFLVAGVQQGLHYRQLKTESADLTARIEQIYRQSFPSGRVVNPRVQMEQQLTALRRQQGAGGGDFFGLVGKMGGALAAAQGIELVSASFRDGRLDLELTASDIQTLDKLKQQLTAAGGLSVDIQSATAGANQRVQGRLRLQGTES